MVVSECGKWFRIRAHDAISLIAMSDGENIELHFEIAKIHMSHEPI